MPKMIERARQGIIEDQRVSVAYGDIFNAAVSILREYGKPERDFELTLGLATIPVVRHTVNSSGIPIEISIKASRKNLDKADKVWIGAEGIKRPIEVKRRKIGDRFVYEGGTKYSYINLRLSPTEVEDCLKSVRDVESLLAIQNETEESQ